MRHPSRVLPAAAAAAALLVASSGTPAAGAGAASPILPGYWESENHVSFPVNDNSTSRQCITPQQVSEFLSGPSSKHFKCSYSKSRAAGGKVSAEGVCVDKNGIRSNVAVEGVYTDTSFDLNAEVRIMIGGVPIPIQASTKARRIAETCPSEAG